MLALIDHHRVRIVELCREFHVTRLDLFGSGGRGDFDDQTSDLDFFVEFENLGWKGSFRRYMGLKLALEKLFGRNVDLVEPGAIVNPYFLQIANLYRSVVYAA